MKIYERVEQLRDSEHPSDYSHLLKYDPKVQRPQNPQSVPYVAQGNGVVIENGEYWAYNHDMGIYIPVPNPETIGLKEIRREMRVYQDATDAWQDREYDQEVIVYEWEDGKMIVREIP